MADPLDIPRWVVQAGWGMPDATIAVAVALRQPDPAKPGGLFGLGTAGDGAAQAKAAYASYKAGGWSVFPAYRDNSYLLYMPTAGVLLAALTPSVAIEKGGQEIAEATGIADAQRIAGWLTNPRAWERITQVVIGVIFVAGSGFLIAKRVGYDPVIRTFTKADRAVARQTGLSLTVGASTAPSGGGSSPGPPGPAGPPGPRGPKPKRPKRRRDPDVVAPRTVPISEPVQRARHNLGAQEAIAQGHAPARGTAPPPPRPLPGSSDTPKKRRRTSE